MLRGVILAGGRGERFWPLSRRSRPKQLLHLMGTETLLQTTWHRLRHRLEPAQIGVIAAADLRDRIHADIPELMPGRFIAEAVGRNTAPAVAVAAALAVRDGENPLQLVVPADHWIATTADFWASVDVAVAVAQADDSPLVTFGIPITRPEPGYGYIEKGAARREAPRAFAVRCFHEKPDRATAAAYAEAGTHCWNSGIFVWRAAALLEELARCLPELHSAVTRLIRTKDVERLLPEILAQVPAVSIDNAVLEHSQRVAVVEAGFRWSDVGNWSSWSELIPVEPGQNIRRGDVISLQSEGCVLVAEEGLIATFGVRDLVVVRTADVTLVIDREHSQDVRQILRALRENQGLEGYL